MESITFKLNVIDKFELDPYQDSVYICHTIFNGVKYLDWELNNSPIDLEVGTIYDVTISENVEGEFHVDSYGHDNIHDYGYYEIQDRDHRVLYNGDMNVETSCLIDKFIYEKFLNKKIDINVVECDE